MPEKSTKLVYFSGKEDEQREQDVPMLVKLNRMLSYLQQWKRAYATMNLYRQVFLLVQKTPWDVHKGGNSQTYLKNRWII